MTAPIGFLYSRIGYDVVGAKRAILRGPAGLLPTTGASFSVFDAERGGEVFAGSITHWGAMWGSDWWIADFSALSVAGTYIVSVRDEFGNERSRSEPISIAPNILWDQTWHHVGIGQGERRALLAMNKIGWQDCGSVWQEANSHAAFIIGFCDILEFAAHRLDDSDRQRLEAQIRNGCDYLALLQDRAGAQGLGEGAVSHQTPKFEEIVLPSDVAQCSVAWARAARFLTHSEKAQEYARRAEAAFVWLKTATPLGAIKFTHSNSGAPDDFTVPSDEWLTRDLMMQAWAAFELTQLGLGNYQDDAVRLADQILSRQVRADASEGTFFGHFRLFDHTDFTEKAWTHNVLDDRPGADTGGHFPHYILPILRMRQAWPDHPLAARWEASLRDFAYGYFLPACRANPFGLLPLGYFTGPGLLWFAGLWHGMNSVYALAAALALEFETFFGDAQFREIAVGNLQWIAGLNAGVTVESLAGCVIWSADIPSGVAVPCSLINGIGTRDAGSWFNARGSICNGFSTGAQFAYDVAPTLENDGPHTLTDEDWITHAGAWLSAISRLQIPA